MLHTPYLHIDCIITRQLGFALPIFEYGFCIILGVHHYMDFVLPIFDYKCNIATTHFELSKVFSYCLNKKKKKKVFSYYLSFTRSWPNKFPAKGYFRQLKYRTNTTFSFFFFHFVSFFTFDFWILVSWLCFGARWWSKSLNQNER